jgi:ribosomal protein L37AE/L43A
VSDDVKQPQKTNVIIGRWGPRYNCVFCNTIDPTMFRINGKFCCVPCIEAAHAAAQKHKAGKV